MAKMLMINADKCTGCHNCELACSMAHEGVFRPDATRVHVYTWEREGFSVPMMCQHCRDAPCITVCTPHALTRDPATGWVNLDDAKCIGCKMCVQACPFGNAVWDELTAQDPQMRQLRRRSRMREILPEPRAGMGGRPGCDADAQARVRGEIQASFFGVRPCTGGSEKSFA